MSFLELIKQDHRTWLEADRLGELPAYSYTRSYGTATLNGTLAGNRGHGRAPTAHTDDNHRAWWRFGPLHDHKDRPGMVYILQGTITDHRNGVATD